MRRESKERKNDLIDLMLDAIKEDDKKDIYETIEDLETAKKEAEEEL